MKLEIHPFEASDEAYAALVEISNRNWPEELSAVASWQHRDKTRPPERLYRRLVAKREGRIVAYAAYGESPWSHLPGKYFISIEVHPELQRQGIGKTLYDHVTGELAERDPLMLTADTREDKPDFIRFLEQRGFVQQMRYPISHLEVPTFDFSAFAGAQERVSGQGVEILDIPTLAERDPDWQRKWYEVEWETFKDVPLPEPPTKETFEFFCTRFEAPSYEASAHFIALDGEDFVGLTGFWLSVAEPSKLYTGLTGVLRSHRRRGIAMALKLKAIAWAQARGKALIETDNEENNPMFDLNVQLGFQAKPAWVDFRKVLRETRGDEVIPEPSRG